MTTRSGQASKPIEHPKPSLGTVKLLYAAAVECAKPGCRAGLFKVNSETGQHALNSNIAHIHARSEGGPRWNPDMSAAQNRDASNLLLLCLHHALEIDQFADEYPAEMLREWKRGQVAAYEHGRQSVTISDEEAEAAIGPVDLAEAIEKISAVVPFNPRMRSRAQAWQLAARRGHGLRLAHVTPFVPAPRRPAVLAWMATTDGPALEVEPGQVRVLVAQLGAGKTELALRWWEQGLLDAASDEQTEIPVFLTARHVTAGLELAVVSELGGEPTRPCRVVLDDLDGVSIREANQLLLEARQLVQVWPTVSLLATARPDIQVPDEERVLVDSWPVGRGAELMELALGRAVPWYRWTAEQAQLLSSPLTALGLATRLDAGRDAPVTRAQLLASLAEDVIRSRDIDVSGDTWSDLARLAIRVLAQSEPVSTADFGPLPRVRRITATDLVVADRGGLTFALPVFEQYFGAEALRQNLIDLETIAAATAFPRWRYAIALALSTATDKDQEALLVSLAEANPGAAFWVLDEVAGATGDETHDGASDETIAALITRRDPTGALVGGQDLAVRAVRWLRGAEQALLSGLGPLAPTLVRHRDGQLVQWGAHLGHGYVTLARSRDQPPTPDVILLTEPHPSLGLWHRTTQRRFPTSDFGRWLHAREELRHQLKETIRRRRLPVPATSVLARERLYKLAAFAYNHRGSSRRREIDLREVRVIVAEWMETVNRSVRASWGSKVDSDDVRWLSDQLAAQSGDSLLPPWPRGDQPGTRWLARRFSPELALQLATSIVRAAVVGYQELAETAFPKFGDALGLYSMLPVRVDGLVKLPAAEEDYPIQMLIRLASDPATGRSAAPTVDLQLANDDHLFWEFSQQHRSGTRTAFGPEDLQSVDLPLHLDGPATSLTYRWLIRDLIEVGWLDNDHWLRD